ncbi:MAG: hypothetical protein QM656_03085 [Paracoccaceae bacterium]
MQALNWPALVWTGQRPDRKGLDRPICEGGGCDLTILDRGAGHLGGREDGGIDILVNNAAIYAGLERKGFESIDETVWDRFMVVKGQWQMTRAFAPHLRAAGQSSPSSPAR